MIPALSPLPPAAPARPQPGAGDGAGFSQALTALACGSAANVERRAIAAPGKTPPSPAEIVPLNGKTSAAAAIVAVEQPVPRATASRVAHDRPDAALGSGTPSAHVVGRSEPFPDAADAADPARTAPADDEAVGERKEDPTREPERTGAMLAPDPLPGPVLALTVASRVAAHRLHPLEAAPARDAHGLSDRPQDQSAKASATASTPHEHSAVRVLSPGHAASIPLTLDRMSITPAQPTPSPAGVTPPLAADRRAPFLVNPPGGSPTDPNVATSSGDRPPARDALPPRESAERAAAAQPASPIPSASRPVASGPAAQVFAAELRRGARDAGPVPAAADAAMQPPASPTLTVAAPIAPAIDTSRERWPFAMVERIERMRGDAAAVDTRVRLVPDALGAVEVSVRREGDAVHVHFAVEQAATRQLLQDAAPRLAEAAEARGLRLGQMGVGGGQADANGSRRQAAAPPAPPIPPRARRDAPAEDRTDIRIA